MRRSTRTNQTASVTVVAFGIDRECKLTDVKVLAVAELATNKYALPVWHLVSDSNSIPVKGFNYGEHIRGMRPQIKGARPDALESNATYRLLVQAKGQKGQHDFKIGGKKEIRSIGRPSHYGGTIPLRTSGTTAHKLIGSKATRGMAFVSPRAAPLPRNSAKNQIFRLQQSESPTMDEIKGRFAQLLPTKVPDDATRDLANAMLKVNGVDCSRRLCLRPAQR